MSCFNALKQGVLAAALLTALPVAAKTLTVTGVGEPATISSASCPANICPTLRDAINAAASGDTIMFGNAINGKTILLSLSSNDISAGSIEFGASAFFVTDGLGETVGKSLTIDGTSHGVTIARDAAATPFRLFDVGSKSSLGLRGLTLRNGLAQGGNSKGGGGALGAGGAIFNQGALAIDACALVGNSAQGGSGAIGTGSANGGGGAGQDATSADGGGPNGGMAGSPPRGAGFGGGGGTTLSATDPGGNGGFGGGGGKGGSGIGGGTGGFGGGGGSDAFLPGNGGFGGGVAGGDFDHVPNGGGGGGMGGAIFNDAGTVTLTNTTFYENSATGGNTTYGGTAVAGGNGSGFGGAIFNYAGTLSASFVTLAGNSTATGTGGAGGGTDGGAIYSHADSACGTSDGNICTTGDADLSMVNSVAARSVGSAHDIVVDNSGGTSASNGSGNLIMTQSGFAGTFISSDPKLGALSPYAAGPAPATLPISAASPAYNAAASCNDAKNQTVVNDQRGKSRPLAGTCDIGAYEFDNDYIYANSYE